MDIYLIKYLEEGMNFENYIHYLSNCKCNHCGLHKKSSMVLYKGDPSSEIAFIGEAPGAEEEKQGTPFVGQAGQLLDDVFANLNVNPENFFISNILLCRPPENRTPYVDEIQQCGYHVLSMLYFLPNLRRIVTLGNTSSHYFLKTSNSMKNMHGENYDAPALSNLLNKEVTITPTYHPSAPSYGGQDGLKQIIQKDIKKILNEVKNEIR